MRIAIVTENFFPKVDGVTRTLGRLLEHLNSMGHHVLLAGPESGMDTYAGAELLGTVGLPFPLYPELKMNLWRAGWTKRLVQFAPDVIHLVDPVWLGAVAIAISHLKLPHVPIVTSYHTNLAAYCDHFGWKYIKPFMWQWNLFCHSKGRYTACPSPSTRTMLEHHAFSNVRLWPRGVDRSLFSPVHRSSAMRSEWTDGSEPNTVEKTILLSVGRLSYEKNLGLLIDAYKQMDHTLCHLVLVGHGPAGEEIKSGCEQLGIPVTFTGYLEGNRLATAFASADVFAFPSTTETFGQVVLESMASGLPVVGLMAEGVKDLVEHGKTGLLLETTGLSYTAQCEQYKANLLKLIHNNLLRTQMGANAVRASSHYSWWNAMECMVQVYRDAVEESSLKERLECY
ncbi:hypothetical protein BDF14DRAFT_1852334 [Spinellus fusiger]|nr:hypothetical protein BDF14DRAFT_1852334 [Spinellus fusiger]